MTRPLPLLAALACLTACQTPQTFPEPTEAWATHVGQLQSTGGERSVIGDVVVRREGAQFQLAFESGPGFPLLKLWISGDTARAEGVLARGSWRGHRGGAPERLQPWMMLPEIFNGISPAAPQLKTSHFEAEAQFTGRQLKRLEVSYPASGERLIFVLTK